MPKYTHKARSITKISELARVGIEKLIKTGKLPSDETHKKVTLDFINEYTIDQRKLYTSTFKDLTFREQEKSLNADLALVLPRAIGAHVRRAENDPQRKPGETFKKCIDLIEGLKARLEADPDLKKYV